MAHGGRHMFWVDSMLDLQIANNAIDIEGLLPGLTTNESRMGMTLMRTILCLDIAPLVHDAGEGTQNVSIGVGIASQEAFVAEVLPDPSSSLDFPVGGWIWRCRYRIYSFAADQPAVFNRHVDLDLRNKRKLNNGELYLTTENAPEQGTTFTIVVAGSIRCLFLST